MEGDPLQRQFKAPPVDPSARTFTDPSLRTFGTKAPPPPDPKVASLAARAKTPAEYDAEQSSIVGPVAVMESALQRANATDPALSTVSMVMGGGAEALGLNPVNGPSDQIDYLAKQAPSDPVVQAELQQRAMMAKGGIPGATMAGARGLAGGAEAVFSFVPGAQGVGQVGKGAAAALPKMLLPAAAGAVAPSVPGMDILAELPVRGGRAVARGLGADEGGAAEALGGTLGAVLPAFAPLALAKGAGRAAGAGVVEPAMRVGQSPLSRLGPAVAREGGLGSILKKSPTVGYEAANIGAMLGQTNIAPEASRAAEGFGASPEAAELIGQMTGLGATLPVAAMEGKIANIGVRQGQAERSQADAAKRFAADAARVKAVEAEQVAALRSHEAPMEPTADQRDTAYLKEMEAKDAERKRALAGVAGAVEGARGVEQARVEEAYPPVPPQPKVVPPKIIPTRVTEGPGMDPVAYEEALQRAAPLPNEAQVSAEMRKPVDAIRAEREAAAAKAQSAKDRAASEEWARSAAFDEAAMKWDEMDPAQRAAVAARIPPGILRTGEIGRSFDKYDLAKQEHIAEALRNPEAFADVLPVDPPLPPTTEPAARTAPTPGERAPTAKVNGPLDVATVSPDQGDIPGLMERFERLARAHQERSPQQKAAYRKTVLEKLAPKWAQFMDLPADSPRLDEVFADLQPLYDEMQVIEAADGRTKPGTSQGDFADHLNREVAKSQQIGPSTVEPDWVKKQRKDIAGLPESSPPPAGQRDFSPEAKANPEVIESTIRALDKHSKEELEKFAARLRAVKDRTDPQHDKLLAAEEAIRRKNGPASPDAETPLNDDAPPASDLPPAGKSPVSGKSPPPVGTPPEGARVVKHPTRGTIWVKDDGPNTTYWRDPTDTTSPWAGRFVLASPEFRAEIESAGSHAPAEGPPPSTTPPAPQAPRAEAPPPPAPPESKAAAKARKLWETRLRSSGEVSVKGTEIRLDTTSQPYRVIVNNKEVFSGSPEAAFSRADQEIAKAQRGTTLGSGLGAIDISDPITRRVIRGTLGGATGYIVGLANDEPDDSPEGRAARRALWTAAGIAAATGVPGWQRFAAKPASRLSKKVQPKWMRDYFGNPNETISETVASIERGNLDKQEVGKTQAHMEALRAPDLKGSQARIYQDYLRGDPKAKEVFPKLVAHIRDTNPELADAMEQGADYYKPESLARTAKELELGIRTEEAAEEYPEGHIQRVYQKDTDKPAKPHARGVNRGKVRMGEKAKDAPYWKGSLDPITVELIMDEAGMPRPSGEHTYFRGTDEGGTLVKWFPDKDGEEQRQLFLLALSDYAKATAVKPISAGKIVGGGDDRMVVQVGKGSRADIGHLVSKSSDAPNELLVRAPRSIANEIVKTLGLEPPKVTPAGSRLRYAFKNPGDVAQFENAVRELAVEGSTFNVTPAAKAYFRNRLRGAKVKMGPGQSGGTGHLTEETGPALNYRERREAGEVYNPKAVTFKSSYEQSKRIANAEMWRDYATKSDEHGPFAAEIPVNENGRQEGVDHLGFFKSPDGTEYKALPSDKAGKENWGALAGKGLRRDVYEFKVEQRAIEEQTKGFVHGMLQKWKALKTGTPVWAALNVPSDLAFAYAADTSPVGGPSNWKSYWSVGQDFLRYLRTGDPTHVKRHVEGPGIRFHEKMTTGDADADAVMQSLMYGAKESASMRREKMGETAMDIASLGTLAGRTAKVGAAIGAAGGAAAGTAMGIAEGDDWDEILKRAGKGLVIGAGANLTARSIRRIGPLIDAYFKATAYDIMTKRQGYSHAEARARVRKFFQNYEEPSKAVRMLSGKSSPYTAPLTNPFISFYSELLRIGKNTVAENPVRAAAILSAIPVAGSVYNHFAGTFPNREEKRAAGAVAPTGIVGRNEEGGLTSAELGRVNPGADFLADIHAVLSKGDKDAFRRAITTFGGSTPILNLVDAGKTYFVPDNKDLRTGMEIRRPGESPARAGVRHAMATTTSPLAPEFGTTEQFVEKSLTETYARGSRPDESRPDRAIAQAITGVRLRDIDFTKESRSLRGRLGAELRDLDEWLDKAIREKNIRSNPERRSEIKAKYRADRKAIMERYQSDRKKRLPQPVGGG